MDKFNLGQFITKFVGYSTSGIQGNSGGSNSAPQPALQPGQQNFSQNLNPKAQPQAVIVNTFAVKALPMQNLQGMKMNHLESLDKALYVKDLMNLPKDMKDLLQYVQKNMSSKDGSSQLLASGINLSQMGLLLQQNGKEAVNKLIMAMSNASKQGIVDLSQIKDTMKLINASVSVAGESNTQAIKSLMLLYLPWLPLQEGVGFELEVGSSDGESGASESYLTIMISTKNYGNVNATLILLAGNSVSATINCSDIFPKKELLERINAESKKHSMVSTLAFEQKPMKQSESSTCQAKVNMSNVSEINPFLLLMAHSIIRHTIELDNLATLG